MNEPHDKDPSEESATGREDAAKLVLPSGEAEEYVLECWKVKDGTLVRAGETVALACLASSKDAWNQNGSDSTADKAAGAPLSDSAKHKRPTRRKRLVGEPPPSAEAVAPAPSYSDREQLKNIKLQFADSFAKAKKENSLKGDSNNETSASDVESKRHLQSIPIIAPISGFVKVANNTNFDNENRRTIGRIEPCSHPFIVADLGGVDGLCGVCGIVMPTNSSTTNFDDDDDSGGAPASSSRAMSQVTVSGGLTFKVTKEEGIQMARQNSQRLRQLKKLSLVLDLDHTLVHATADIRACKHLDEREDVRSLVLPFTEDAKLGRWMQHFVKLRPNVKEFLESVMPMYEIGVYTAGTRQYAEQIATVLCRHLVGAKRDQIELDQLRYRVARAEAELKAHAAEKPPTDEREDNDNNLYNAEDKDNMQRTQEANEPTPGIEERPQKKRKVTFATESPPESKEPIVQKNNISHEDLEKLKSESEEAERLELEAAEMRKRLFGSRIVSRSDVGDLGRDVKSLKRIFPCGGTMAAVVDDREDVWANAKDNSHSPRNKAGVSRQGEPPENLLLVKPYHWQPFVGFADINNASGVDLTENLDDKASKNEDSTNEADEQLLWTADILKRLHFRYYSQDENKDNMKTVPDLLSDMRREVLQGLKIVLSGLVPLHKQYQDNHSTKPRPSVVRYVESLGASVQPTVQPDTSYVIAAKDGTDKILMARRITGCFVVKVSWLMVSYWSLTHPDPRQHLLAPTGRDSSAISVGTHNAVNDTGSRPPAAAFPIDKSDDDDEDDDDDDDLAAEFEKELM